MRGNRWELGKVFYMKNYLHFKANSNQLAAQGLHCYRFAIEDTVNGVFQAPINSTVAGASRCY